MLNKAHFVVIASTFLTLIACSDSVPDSTFNEVTAPNAHDLSVERMNRNLDILRRELPRVLDKLTTLETIDFDGAIATFNYRLKLSDLNETQKDTMQSLMDNQHTKVVCAAPETMVGLNMGFDYQYNYYDLDNIAIGSFNITKEICDNL